MLKESYVRYCLETYDMARHNSVKHVSVELSDENKNQLYILPPPDSHMDSVFYLRSLFLAISVLGIIIKTLREHCSITIRTCILIGR